MKPETIESNFTQLNFVKDGKSCTLKRVQTPDAKFKETEWQGLTPFQLAVAGRPHGFIYPMISANSELPTKATLQDIHKGKSDRTYVYLAHENSLEISVHYSWDEISSVIRTHTEAKNISDAPLTLTHLSSAFAPLMDFPIEMLKGDNNEDWRVHYCQQTWQCEGQWREEGLSKLGIYSGSVHPASTVFQLNSIGSFSTANYVPTLYLENKSSNTIWFMQAEVSSSWRIELGISNQDVGSVGSLYFHCDSTDLRHLGWAKKLVPGESFRSFDVAFGCCSGGFDEAAQQLTLYRRERLKPDHPATRKGAPLFFNDFMNCLWAKPTKENLIPLIDNAAQVGAEGFCIDACWFSSLKEQWGKYFGSYIPSEDRFGEGGLQAILDYIKSKDMIPGLWLEMEVCDEKCPVAENDNSWFLCRLGERVGGDMRLFLNYTNPDVRLHMHGIIDRLVAMGVGFIKNDYNDCPGPGDDTITPNLTDSLHVHARAFQTFIDEVRLRHPNLIIENCASGAMRQDYGMLSRFDFQSCSDQEIYYDMPSIICGGLANVLPEQFGVWAYPIPLLYKDKDNPELLDNADYLHPLLDQEHTIFNMVNGMMGSMYLSGRIDYADDHNLALISEACTLFKTERNFIANSLPHWPTGRPAIWDKKSWASMVLADPSHSRMLLAVWRRLSDTDNLDIDLNLEDANQYCAMQVYPQTSHHIKHQWDAGSGILSVNMPRKAMGRLFIIEKITTNNE